MLNLFYVKGRSVAIGRRRIPANVFAGAWPALSWFVCIGTAENGIGNVMN
ncbi:hypothetical protein KEH51_16745 [[Brevibacterium] frigoritolerans]|uniref:Uncharacterized protein n=1 Tax=Peribacillus frigoritolerans TaxID=450367 RepID=A0A941J2Y4_9BACI|nr:hypothetical protein [Peribacillus frigoritolerans]